MPSSAVKRRQISTASGGKPPLRVVSLLLLAESLLDAALHLGVRVDSSGLGVGEPFSDGGEKSGALGQVVERPGREQHAGGLAILRHHDGRVGLARAPEPFGGLGFEVADGYEVFRDLEITHGSTFRSEYRLNLDPRRLSVSRTERGEWLPRACGERLARLSASRAERGEWLPRACGERLARLSASRAERGEWLPTYSRAMRMRRQATPACAHRMA